MAVDIKELVKRGAAVVIVSDEKRVRVKGAKVVRRR